MTRVQSLWSCIASHTIFQDSAQRIRTIGFNITGQHVESCYLVETSNWYPKRHISYYSIKHSLSNLISTPDFVEQCEKWRKRALDVPPGIIGDVYDRRIWKQSCGNNEYKFFLQFSGNFWIWISFNPSPTQHTLLVCGTEFTMWTSMQSWKHDNGIHYTRSTWAQVEYQHF